MSEKDRSEKDFRDQSLNGFWQDLKDHLERDALIVVSPVLDLQKVADLMAKDSVNDIQTWIQEKKIGKPTAEQVAAWNANPTKEVSVNIVQPYVLIQESAH